ncbi:MAG: Sec-independent protein translocase protein TatB [Hyphomicrobiales bacterium]
MFDIGMTEILVIAVVAIIVVGPKDLPGLLRSGAKYIGQIRSMARDFKGQVNEAIKDTELDNIKNDLKGLDDLNPVKGFKDEVDDYMESARAFDLPDDDYIEAGEKMAAEKSAAVAAPKSTPKKPAAKKPAAKKPVAQKPATKKPAARKAATSKTASASVKKPRAKRTTSKTSS